MKHSPVNTSAVETRRFRDLAQKPIGRLLWEYSLPSVVGMLVMQLYNIIDRIFIGQVVGTEAIATYHHFPGDEYRHSPRRACRCRCHSPH